MPSLPDSFLLIDKPAGWTSFDVVNVIRKKARRSRCHPESPGEDTGLPLLTKERTEVRLPECGKKKTPKLRVGHAGTLDPFATGLLIVGVGREATKRLDEFKALPKTYVATIKLGAISDTDDPTGEISSYSVILSTRSASINSAKDPLTQTARDSSVSAIRPSWRRRIPQNDKPSISQIKKTLKKFTGEQTQIPPMYSAKKINGQRLYKLARAGQTVERQPQPINIYEIKFLEYAWPDLKIEVTCSAGTYIRTLARDIGETLGTGGYCVALRRTKIGEYRVEDAEKISPIK